MVNVHALLAVGVNGDGHREILGLQVTSAEDGAGWLGFFRDLTARGLCGVALVTSDAHRGLVEAIGAPGDFGSHARWRRQNPADRAAAPRARAARAPYGRGTWRMATHHGGRWRNRETGRDRITPGQGQYSRMISWRPQQDSNLRTRLRRRSAADLVACGDGIR